MTDASVSPSVLQAAFDKTAAERAALKDDELLAVNVDVPNAYLIVIGSLPEIRAVRAQIVDELPKFDVKKFDAMEDYANALFQSQRVLQTAEAPVEGLVELNDRAFALRDRLFSTAQLLVKLGVINSGRIAEIKNSTGYRNVGVDLSNITQIFREDWAKIENKAPITLEQVVVAEDVAAQLLAAVAQREQAPAAVGRAAEDRARAFTLFARTYDEIRWAVMYVRRHKDDGDKIAPSIYSGRGGRPKKSDEPPVPATTAPSTTSPATAPASGATQPAMAEPAALGGRGGSPFAAE